MCVFCKIISGEIPSKKAYEDDSVLAIYDINPQAPVHIVFMPKQHILTSADGINEENCEIIGKIFVAIAKVAKELGLKDGYRIINNCGAAAGQTVAHIHFHLLAGKDGMSEHMI
ncbi:MAG: histidine triad nucleotide-binding protein [Clostridia bacterium]|nr:histidine triad nucleotide-binding protein [Clostridia bacterium]MBQ4322900.1 histidine triad nucleotide-binding protein [Clostridia bacterium]